MEYAVNYFIINTRRKDKMKFYSIYLTLFLKPCKEIDSERYKNKFLEY